jgi:hypothetical protein
MGQQKEVAAMSWQFAVPAVLFLAASGICFRRWQLAPPENKVRTLIAAGILLAVAVGIVVFDLVVPQWW